ncbi:GTP-binding protein A [Grifola frondosa]|uniref:GTP-binding protein A n=1 Tax=Grifola frondosa TaxID=5627 RepID=A0A1C7LN79_GRIFR|nr:GTP-binding protein A [Grifola frondosa]
MAKNLKKESKFAPKPVTIAVMGPTGAGKTTFINVASGSDFRVGVGLESCTDAMQFSQPFQLDNYSITLIDTPGFDDTSKTDAEVLNMVTEFFSSQYEKGQLLNGIIYMHRISDNRMGGTAVRNFRFFKQLCGDDFLPSSAIVTNMWGEIAPEVGVVREQELFGKDIFFKSAIDAGASPFRHANTAESAHVILRHLAGSAPKVMLIQKELVDEKKPIYATAAGAALLGEIAEREKKHQERLEELRKEMDEAVKAQDEEDMRELEEARAALAAEQAKLQMQKRLLEEASRPSAPRPQSFFMVLLLKLTPCVRRSL